MTDKETKCNTGLSIEGVQQSTVSCGETHLRFIFILYIPAQTKLVKIIYYSFKIFLRF